MFALALLAFVSLGLPDAILGVAWPSLRRTFGVPLDGLGLLLGATVAGYLASSFFGGALTRRFGVGGLLVGSSVLVALGMAGYALAASWGMALLAALLAGLGGGAIDASINAHAADHFRPGQVAWLHASWGVGAALGPLVMTVVLGLGLTWRWGYAIVGGLVAVLALAFLRTRALWHGAHAAHDAAGRAASLGTSLRRPAVQANVLLFFVYTGVESATGQWVYTVFTEARGMATGAAGFTTGAYWASLTLGRVVSGAVTHRVAPAVVLRLALATLPLWAFVVALDLGPTVDRLAVAALGFTAGPIFPLLIAGTPDRVGAAHVANAVGFQVSAAALGTAATPGLAGVLARATSLEAIPAFVTACALGVFLLDAATRRRESPAPPPTPAPDPPTP